MIAHTPSMLKLHAKYPQDIVTSDGRYTVARTLPQPTIAAAETNARRLVACWNMLAGETTEDIESNPLPAMFDQLSTHMEQLEKNCDVILAKCYTLANALQKAATAMETISMSAGKDPYMQTFELVRDYAKKAAVSAGKAAEGGAA